VQSYRAAGPGYVPAVPAAPAVYYAYGAYVPAPPLPPGTYATLPGSYQLYKVCESRW
jgi:hypothetical protein